MRQHSIKKTALCAATFAAVFGGAAQAQQGDPLYRYQWHLMNYGQSVLGDTKPAFGIDLGIDDLHDYNIRGKGVTVAVVDQGVEIAHPDLAANVVANGSWNFSDDSHDPTPTKASQAHGTAVAGIIASVGWNGIGGRGVAPAARLKSFNYLSVDDATKQPSLEDVWLTRPELADVQVSNNSWGAYANYLPAAISENEIAADERALSATRGGLGTIYIKSAGNGFSNWSAYADTGNFNVCGADALAAGVGCSQAIWDGQHGKFNVMVIAAADASGQRSTYSTPGASIWVAGLGGEYGWQRQGLLNAGYSEAVAGGQAAYLYEPAIVTTDLSGCARGYNNNAAGSGRSVLDSDRSLLDNTCNYTGSMNGTSAAAPTVSGVVALMLQVNPKLSFRDVKYILATTARQIDPNQAQVRDANGTVIAPGWITNAAGRRFSNWYGFGLVDATLAVTRAGNFKSLPALRDSGWQRAQLDVPVAIGNAAAPATASVRIANGPRNIEAVQIGLDTDYVHAGTWQQAGGATATPLLVTLRSPGGTRAFVLPAHSAYGGRVLTIPFSSVNAFLDESSDGDWTVEVADVDRAAGVASAGNLTSFKLRVLGH
ncbi:S8 family serine peptidase [Pseudomonas sp. CGJS7]|uniref:S8 family serine peptidase n=1 Tax=Pseudomonas sp. CGJS7 TaxID=3109348 RepID=UPI00300915C7